MKQDYYRVVTEYNEIDLVAFPIRDVNYGVCELKEYDLANDYWFSSYEDAETAMIRLNCKLEENRFRVEKVEDKEE